MTDISEYDNQIDSRDVLKRLEELDLEIEDCRDEEAAELGVEREELSQLVKDLGYASHDEPSDGIQMINDGYFREYAIDLWDETTSPENRVSHWPYTCIDWDQAADELRSDYTSVEFRSVTFWVR